MCHCYNEQDRRKRRKMLAKEEKTREMLVHAHSRKLEHSAFNNKKLAKLLSKRVMLSLIERYKHAK